MHCTTHEQISLYNICAWRIIVSHKQMVRIIYIHILLLCGIIIHVFHLNIIIGGRRSRNVEDKLHVADNSLNMTCTSQTLRSHGMLKAVKKNIKLYYKIKYPRII